MGSCASGPTDDRVTATRSTLATHRRPKVAAETQTFDRANSADFDEPEQDGTPDVSPRGLQTRHERMKALSSPIKKKKCSGSETQHIFVSTSYTTSTVTANNVLTETDRQELHSRTSSDLGNVSRSSNRAGGSSANLLYMMSTECSQNIGTLAKRAAEGEGFMRDGIGPTVVASFTPTDLDAPDLMGGATVRRNSSSGRLQNSSLCEMKMSGNVAHRLDLLALSANRASNAQSVPRVPLGGSLECPHNPLLPPVGPTASSSSRPTVSPPRSTPRSQSGGMRSFLQQQVSPPLAPTSTTNFSMSFHSTSLHRFSVGNNAVPVDGRAEEYDFGSACSLAALLCNASEEPDSGQHALGTLLAPVKQSDQSLGTMRGRSVMFDENATVVTGPALAATAFDSMDSDTAEMDDFTASGRGGPSGTNVPLVDGAVPHQAQKAFRKPQRRSNSFTISSDAGPK